MQELFFSTSRPRHSYKSGLFFNDYLRLRDQSTFGQVGGKQDSIFKKMLVLKKFFFWYYSLLNRRQLKQVFSKTFAKKRLTFRTLTNFFHLLERNLIVVLVRSGYAVDIKDALYQIKAGLVYVNGSRVSTNFFILKTGDTFETFQYPYRYLVWYKALLFYTRNFSLFRLTYFDDFVTMFLCRTNQVPLLRRRIQNVRQGLKKSRVSLCSSRGPLKQKGSQRFNLGLKGYLKKAVWIKKLRVKELLKTKKGRSHINVKSNMKQPQNNRRRF